MIEAQPLAAMTLAVVGMRHANADRSNRQFEIMLCKPGDPVELRPEPKNKHDERAIAVFSERGVQLGYLTAERAPRIGQLIRQGREVCAVFQRGSPFGAWIRVAFDGAIPLVPRRDGAELIEPEGGWFPDDLWPDD